jgi:4-alpha-glucanotransferase
MHLVLCIHNHQPVGNMDFILEEAYAKAYAPFFEVMKEFSDIKVNLHFSGYLFEWLVQHKPDYVSLLKALKDEGRIEVISGGMYEPVLSLLPEDDAVSQIRMHLDLMENIFGERPKGMWLAERVYEPQMPKILSKAGISYTLVDDNHFKAVGFSDDELYGYFITEYEGERIFIFPGLEVLRYAIPFKPVVAIDEYFKEVKAKRGDLLVFGDDGEKFGLWPGTYNSVYKENWLRGFFAYLSKNKSWLKTVTFGEYLAEKPPRGLTYLDCASYKEMGEWCLPARLTTDYSSRMNDPDVKKRRFLKGGYFKHFLVKYREANDMHKKMLSLSDKAKGNGQARKHLFMAQANDSYWHGVFGGLYLPHLRASVYEHLIEAEKCLDPKEPFTEGYFQDINVDGRDEAVLRNDILGAYFQPAEGGTLYELDYKPSSANLMATLQRRYEGYHDKIKAASSAGLADGTKTIHDMVIAKEEGLEQYLFYDWHRRASLIDHLMGTDVTLETFYKSRYREPGDFVKEPYEAVLKKAKKSMTLCMTRNGHFWKEGEGFPLSISKDVTVTQGSGELSITYLIQGQVGEKFLLGIEFNFSLLGTGGERYIETEHGRWPLTTRAELQASRRVMCHDPYQQVDVSLQFDMPSRIWTFPVEVVSLSESGFERNYQSTMVMPLWEIDLSGGPMRIEVRLALHDIGSHNNLP